MMSVGHVLDHVPDHVLDHVIIGLVATALQPFGFLSNKIRVPAGDLEGQINPVLR